MCVSPALKRIQRYMFMCVGAAHLVQPGALCALWRGHSILRILALAHFPLTLTCLAASVNDAAGG